MKVTGKRAVAGVRHALAEAGMARTSRMAGAEPAGWIATNVHGSTGFSVKPNIPMERDKKAVPGELLWHVVVSGKPHMRYRKYRWDGDELHEPVNPEILLPRIKAVFERLGIEVRSVECVGHQTMFDDDVNYNVVTGHPAWLEEYKPKNPFARCDEPTLAAMVFRSYPSVDTPPAPLSAPLVGYVRDGVHFLTRESLEKLVEVLAAQEQAAKAEGRATTRDYSSFAMFGKAPRYGHATLSPEGEFHMTVPGRPACRTKPVEIVNHWGDLVQVWPMPQTWMEARDPFRTDVPFLQDGEMRQELSVPTYEAQFGADAPWAEPAPAVKPGL